MDFSIAERFGVDAVRDTFNRVFKEWKGNYEYLTELVMVLNWKPWFWSELNERFADLYFELYEKADEYAISNLKDEELDYFLRTVD